MLCICLFIGLLQIRQQGFADHHNRSQTKIGNRPLVWWKCVEVCGCNYCGTNIALCVTASTIGVVTAATGSIQSLQGCHRLFGANKVIQMSLDSATEITREWTVCFLIEEYKFYGLWIINSYAVWRDLLCMPQGQRLSNHS